MKSEGGRYAGLDFAEGGGRPRPDAVDVECDGATLARLLGVAEADAPRLVGAAPAPVPDVEFGAPGTLADALRHYDQGRFPEFLEAGLACLPVLRATSGEMPLS